MEYTDIKLNTALTIDVVNRRPTCREINFVRPWERAIGNIAYIKLYPDVIPVEKKMLGMCTTTEMLNTSCK